MTTSKSIIIGTAANRRPAPGAERRRPSTDARDHARTPIAGEANPRIIHGDCRRCFGFNRGSKARQ